MVHLADNYLSPTGMMIFNGNKNVLNGDRKSAPLEHIAKGTVMQLSLNLSVKKLKEDIVYENSCITTMACEPLIQDRLKALYPGRNYKKEFLDMKHVAHLMKFWAAGHNRPANGTVFSFETLGKNGQIIMPKYHN
jgi:hypothetical protein